MHVDVWDNFTADLTALTDGVQDLTDEAVAVHSAIDMLTSKTIDLMNDILGSQGVINGVANDLAEQKVIDAAQDAMIENLTHDVTKVENSCRDLENMTTLFGMVIDSLPSYSDLETRLAAVKAKNVALRMTSGANKTSITDLTTAVASGNIAVNTINANVGNANTALMYLNTEVIGVNTLAIAADLVDLINLEADLKMQTILNDYFYVNAGILTFDGIDPLIAVPITTDPAASTFCAPPGITVEFHLTATTSANNGALDADITSIGLY